MGPVFAARTARLSSQSCSCSQFFRATSSLISSDGFLVPSSTEQPVCTPKTSEEKRTNSNSAHFMSHDWNVSFREFLVPCSQVKCRRQFRGSMGSGGFEKVLIGTLGPRETFYVGRRGERRRTAFWRAAQNTLGANGTGHTGPSRFCATSS